uniref:(northern house mosquito) hypothetical protein n=1 Tax=Culex pipiens TaxID=7175 RepID=A0A8D8C3N3_CULPI
MSGAFRACIYSTRIAWTSGWSRTSTARSAASTSRCRRTLAIFDTAADGHLLNGGKRRRRRSRRNGKPAMCCCISSTEFFFFCACKISVRRKQRKIILVLSVIDSISQGDDDLYDLFFFLFVAFCSCFLIIIYLWNSVLRLFFSCFIL